MRRILLCILTGLLCHLAGAQDVEYKLNPRTGKFDMVRSAEWAAQFAGNGADADTYHTFSLGAGRDTLLMMINPALHREAHVLYQISRGDNVQSGDVRTRIVWTGDTVHRSDFVQLNAWGGSAGVSFGFSPPANGTSMPENRYYPLRIGLDSSSPAGALVALKVSYFKKTAAPVPPEPPTPPADRITDNLGAVLTDDKNNILEWTGERVDR